MIYDFTTALTGLIFTKAIDFSRIVKSTVRSLDFFAQGIIDLRTPAYNKEKYACIRSLAGVKFAPALYMRLQNLTDGNKRSCGRLD